MDSSFQKLGIETASLVTRFCPYARVNNLVTRLGNYIAIIFANFSFSPSELSTFFFSKSLQSPKNVEQAQLGRNDALRMLSRWFCLCKESKAPRSDENHACAYFHSSQMETTLLHDQSCL